MTDDSIYESELPDRPSYPVPEGRTEADVAIVGGGLTGMSAALTLAESGISAVVLEAGRIGAGGSGRNGGHLCRGWPTDFDKISRQLDAGDADIAWQVGMDAVELVKRRIARYAISCDLSFGYLHAALHRRQMDELDSMQAKWEARGYEYFTRLGDPSSLAEHIGSAAYVGALHDTGCGHLQPLKYLHGLARAAHLQGVQIYEGAAVRKSCAAAARPFWSKEDVRSSPRR